MRLRSASNPPTFGGPVIPPSPPSPPSQSQSMKVISSAAGALVKQSATQNFASTAYTLTRTLVRQMNARARV